MKKFILTLLLFCLFSVYAFASQNNIQFYFIHPGGEGDSEDATPYIVAFYDYLKENTGVLFDGLYLNDKEEAIEALAAGKIQLAIMSPEFIAKYKEKFQLKTLLKTIPTYSSGPYEKYFIIANKNTKIIDLAEKNKAVKLYASVDVDNTFLNNVIFGENEMIKKISWKLTNTSEILSVIKTINESDTNSFALLTGYEFSVIQKLKNNNKNFTNLQLVFSSTELPSSHLVVINQNNKTALDNIKKVLLTMPHSLKGNLILKRLRLKGFAE